MKQGVDHIGIAVRDIDAVLSRYKQIFGMEPAAVTEVADLFVKMAIIKAGNIEIHLLAPTAPGAGPIGAFLQERGEGFHHIGFRVDDVEKTAARFAELNAPVPEAVPINAPGGIRVVFNEPGSTQNVLFELFDGKGSL